METHFRKGRFSSLDFSNLMIVYLSAHCLIVALLIIKPVTAVNCEDQNYGVKCDKSVRVDEDADKPILENNKHQQQTQLSMTQFMKWLFGTPEHSKKRPVVPTTTTISLEESHNFSTPQTPQNSNTRTRNEKNIEIEDIQPSIGTEVDASKLSSDPSQVNLKEGVDLVEEFDKHQNQQENVSDSRNVSSKRIKRSKKESRFPPSYKPVKVPYVTTPTSPNYANSQFLQRQLLVNPALAAADPTFIALQQQQQAAAAAAAMLHHQQQMDTLLNGGNRFASLIDDYDDHDEDSDEDESDENDEILMRFPVMMEQHHHMGPFFRDGLPMAYHQPQPPFHKRRSVSRVENKNKKRRHNQRKFAAGNGFGRPSKFSVKRGQWFLDDYDLHSEFYDMPQERKNIPKNLHLTSSEEEPEVDEEEHYRRHIDEKAKNKQRKVDKISVPEVRHKDETDSIPIDFHDNLCPNGECLQPELRQTSDTTTAGTTMGTTMTTTMATTETTTTPTDTTTTPTDTTTMDTTTTGLTDTTITGSTTRRTTRRTTRTTTTTTTPKPKPPYKATLNCRCGTQSVRGEGISEDVIVRFNVNPWLVAISNSSGHICSGSIINDRFILTSKQCVRNSTPDSLNVIAGLTSKAPRNFSVSKISPHPKVNIALLQLNSTIKPSHKMRPVCLPIGKRFAGQYSTGMVITFKKGPGQGQVQMVDTEVGILNATACKSKQPGTFCAGPPGSIRCGGDTGGILMVYRGGYSYEQIGVVAGTVGCRARSAPGVYTDIRKKAGWILFNSRTGNYCKSPRVTPQDLMSTKRVGDPYFDATQEEDELLQEAQELEKRGHNDGYGWDFFESSEEDEDLSSES